MNLRTAISLIWPFLAGASVAVAWRARRQAKRMHGYVRTLEDANSRMGEMMARFGMMAAASGLGTMSHLQGGDRGFVLCLDTEDGHLHYSYDIESDKFFKVGMDENVEVDPASDECDLPLPIRTELLQSKVDFLEMLKAKRGAE